MKKAMWSTGLFRRMLSAVLAVCVVGQAVPAGAVALERGAAAEGETLESLPSMVMGELEDRRTATSKSFRMSDGTVLVADYGMPVHYQEGEQWTEIDNTLTAEPAGAEGGFDGFVTKDGLGSVKFGADLSGGTIFGMENDGYGLRVKLPSAEIRAKIAGAKAGGKSEAEDEEKEEGGSSSSEPASSSSQSSASESSSSGSEASSSSGPESESASSASESSPSAASGSGAPGEGASSSAGVSLQAQSSEATQSSSEASSSSSSPSGGASSSGASSPSSSEASKESKQTETEPPKPLKSVKSVKAELIDVKAEAEAELSESRAAEKAAFDEKYKTASDALRSVLDRTRAIEEHNDKQTQLKTQTGGVRYLGGYDGADLEYYASGNTVKENIVVHSPQEAYTYTFELELQGLRPNALDDGRIQLLNDKGEEVYIIQAPILIDADGALGFDARNEITEIDGKVYLTVTAGKAWFEEEGRAFPVKIDPTIQYTTGIDVWSANATVFDGNASPRRNDSYIIAGMLPGIGRARGYLKFGQSQIPQSAMIVNATLRMQMYECYQYPNLYGGIYPYTNLNIAASMAPAYWDSGTITWGNQPIQSGATPYQYLVTSDAVKFDVGFSRTVYYDITKIMQEWYQGTAQDFGLIFTHTYEWETFYKYMYFTSHTVAGGQPFMMVYYRDMLGLESCWNSYGHGLTSAGAGAVTLAGGNLTYTLPVFSDSGLRLPLSFSLIYNSRQRNMTYPLHAGNWQSNYSQLIMQATGLDQQYFKYIYIDADGTPHYFTDAGGGKAVDEDGLGLDITVSGNEFVLTSKTGVKIYFENASVGKLKRVVDQNGNTITVTHGSSSTAFSYGPNRTATAYHDASGNITSFVDCYGQAVSFSYSGGQLVSLTYPDGRTVSLSYTTILNRPMLTTIQNAFGDQLIYEYSGNERWQVLKITEYAAPLGGGEPIQGQSIGFDYTVPNSTRIRTSGVNEAYGDADDICTRYVFDSFGRTTSVHVTDAAEKIVYGASNQAFTTDQTGLKKNKVIQSSGMQMVRTNLLSDGSYESSFTMLQKDVVTWTDYSGLVSSSTAQKYYGAKSAQFTYTGSNLNSPSATHELSLPAGTYTLSGYVKTENIIPHDSAVTDQGFGLTAVWTSHMQWSDVLQGSSANTFSVDSASGATDSGANYQNANNQLNSDLVAGWRRLQLTFELTTATTVYVGFGMNQATGTAFVDGLKLEKSGSPSAFNLLRNESFENNSTNAQGNSFPNYWTFENAVPYHDRSVWGMSNSKGSFPAIEGSNAFWFDVAAGENAMLTQSTSIAGAKVNDVYTFSGWAAGNAMTASKNTPTTQNPDRRFAVEAVIFYSNGTNEVFTAPLNPYYMGWQYVSGMAIVKDKGSGVTATSIQIRLAWFDQPGFTLFDNIALIKEDGQSYTYDANGNVQKIADINGQQIGAVYNALNLVTEFTDTLGNKTAYTYDNYKLKTTTSPMGLKTEFGYAQDSGGVATSAKVTAADAVREPYTKLLLHFDGNTADSSDFGHTVSGSPNSYSSVNAIYGQSARFNGNTITVPKTAETTFGDKDFTIDWWEYNYALTTYDSAICNISGVNVYSMMLNCHADGKLYMSSNGTSWQTELSMGGRETNVWTHYAVTRSGNTIRIFKNGVQKASGTFTGSVYQSGNFVIGTGWGTTPMNGLLDDFRVNIGTALWTSNFTPQGTPTVDSQVKLYLKFDSNLTDSSIYNNQIVQYDPYVGMPTASTTAKIGTSMKFQRNSAITVPKTANTTLGDSDFTLDWWQYNIDQYDYSRWLFNLGGNMTNSLAFEYARYPYDADTYAMLTTSTGGWNVWGGTSTYQSWTHYAITRQGNTLRVFKNGAVQSTTAISGSVNQPGNMVIGTAYYGWFCNCYIDNFRLIVGRAEWTSNFTPQTTEYSLYSPPPATPADSTYKSYRETSGTGNLYSSTEFLDNYNYAYGAVDSLGNVSKTYYRVYDPDYTDTNGKDILPDSLTAAPYSTANSGAPGYTDPTPGNNRILGQVAATEAPDGSRVFYAYDPNTLQLTGISKAVGAGEAAVSYMYDSKYRLSEIVHNGFSYLFSYDAFGNTTQIAIKEGENVRVLTTNFYAANNGRLLRSTYGNEDYVETTIDELGRTKQKLVNGEVTASYGYDMQGNVTWEKDHLTGITWTYTYDLSGALTRASNSEGYDKTYRRDLGGNLVAETTALGGETRQTGYTYDKDQKPVLQKILGAAAGELQSENTYDGLGRITTKTWRTKTDDQTVSQTKLLLHFDGNTTDSSDFGHTVSGNPNSYSSVNAIYGQAARFNGNTVTVPKTAETTLGDKDFTIDWWEYNYDNSILHAATANMGGMGAYSMLLNAYQTGELFISNTGNNWTVTAMAMGAKEVGKWTHYAVTRSGNTIRTFKNGSLQATAAFSGSVYQNGPIQLGGGWCGVYMNGLLDDFRVTIGRALWTGNFTPPATVPTSTTKLLMHFDSSTADAMDKNIVSNTPAGYDSITKKFGASAYFCGQLVTIPKTANTTLGASDFTIDWWERTTNNSSSCCHAAINAGGMGAFSMLLSYYTGQLYMSNNGSSWTISAMNMGNKTINGWDHVAVTRRGNTIYTFRNGVLQATAAFSGSVYQNGPFTIGGGWNNIYLYAYVDEVRVVIGEAKWISNFTPPTAPYTGLEGSNIPSTPASSTYKSYATVPGETLTELTADYAYTPGAGGANAQSTQISEVAYKLGGVFQLSHRYSYDTLGNVVRVEEKTSETGSYTDLNRYEYDDLGQLVRHDDVAADRTVVYTYDNAGNILSEEIYTLTAETAEPTGAPIDQAGWEYEDSTWKDLLTSFTDVDENTTEFEYDEIGNPLNWTNDSTLAWQKGRQLANYTVGDVTTTYTYNAAGQRVSKQTGESVTQYVYDGGKLFKESRPDGAYLLYHYDIAGQLFAFDYVNGETTTRYFYQRNLTGEITGLYDSVGILVAQYTYDAWGKVLSIKDGSGNDVSANAGHIANINPVRYKGYYYDQENGLYYLMTRFYDPQVKRFLNGDVLIDNREFQGQNVFVYGFNNPINFEDPSGMVTVASLEASLAMVYRLMDAAYARNDFYSGAKYLKNASDIKRQIAALTAPQNEKPGNPVKDGVKSSDYGGRTLNGQPNTHYGVDIIPDGIVEKDRINISIFAARSGVVKYAGDEAGFIEMTGGYPTKLGNVVVIELFSGEWMIYSHLDSSSVRVGDIILVGDPIGIMGNTTSGSSLPRHLHLEVWCVGNEKKEYYTQKPISPGGYYVTKR